MKVSIVIPTLSREQVLLDTINELLGLDVMVDEIIVVDQTPKHLPGTNQQLGCWHQSGKIRLIRRTEPSITAAMNDGLKNAVNALVLFVDDDIVPKFGLIGNHLNVHLTEPDCWVTAGQVIQPWQTPESLPAESQLLGIRKDFDFPFNSTQSGRVSTFIGCNFCVKKEKALAIGGFDENFIGSAFRYEADFARRVIKAGGEIRFVASASIDHLRVSSGGTRSKDNHLKSASPLHGFGDYYYAFRHGKGMEAWRYSVNRLFREVRTKFHLTHPWWIPIKLIGEFRALWAGWRMAKRPPKLIKGEAN